MTEAFIKAITFTLYCLAGIHMSRAEEKVRELMDEKI